MTSATASAHSLDLWADGRKVATLCYEPLNDRWSLDYDHDWIDAAEAFPLSPALPLVPSLDGYAVGAVKRFVENLLPEGRALEFGEIPEPPDAQRADRFIAGIGDDMRGLIVVSVEGLLRLDVVLFHETDAADGVGMQQLLVGRHDLGTDLIVGRSDGHHLGFHNWSPFLRRVEGSRPDRPGRRKEAICAALQHQR